MAGYTAKRGVDAKWKCYKIPKICSNGQKIKIRMCYATFFTVIAIVSAFDNIS